MGFGGFFKKIAPWLSAGAQFIPGAGPVIAGTINQIAGASGHPEVTATGTLDSITDAVAALSGNADALLKIKQADQDYAKQMQLLGFQHEDDIEKMFLDDRANARNREIQIRDKVPALLAAGITIGFFGTLWYVFGHGVKQEAHDLALTMVGVLGTAWTGVVGYYFGSSRGSDDKTKVIADIAKMP